MAKAETAVVKAIIDALTAAGIWCWRQNAGGVAARGGWFHGGPDGIPDIVGVIERGRMFGIEAKVPTGKQRETQKAWEAMAARHGVLYGLALTAPVALRLINKWRTEIALGQHQ
jgi:hypothetical protein